MSSPNHPTFDIEDAFSFNFPDYFPASSGNISPNSSNDFTKYLFATIVFSPLYDDPHMKVMQAYDATNELPIPPLQAPIEISPPKDVETPVESSIPVCPSSSVGSSSPVRPITPPPYYPFDESIFAELDNSLWIIPRPLGSKPVLEEPNESDAHLWKNYSYSVLFYVDRMDLKRTSTSAAPTMNQASIWQLIDDRVAATLEAQSANMANTDNTSRNSEPRETPAARKLFSHSNCTEDCKVKFSTGILTEDALSWWISYAKPIGIEQANKISWSELKRLLTNKYYPRTKFKKMEDEFYNLVVKGNDLKTYIRRF
uniref:Reverse transcriptase domain-containing protein n=1 Tax=Tanacetum cinerariifolium TaxID=118510 RepID=A0A6L2JSK4_TANCI|nr:reverse transcriptase domain-containing protein [Tanacetum cinerariifolium]